MLGEGLARYGESRGMSPNEAADWGRRYAEARIAGGDAPARVQGSSTVDC
ncbi:hypothetical protein NKH18_50485 [Streptomyces sp. M10(2022)]